MFGESMAAARFQIQFKSPCLFLRFERNVGFDFPRLEFGLTELDTNLPFSWKEQMKLFGME